MAVGDEHSVIVSRICARGEHRGRNPSITLGFDLAVVENRRCAAKDEVDIAGVTSFANVMFLAWKPAANAANVALPLVPNVLVAVLGGEHELVGAPESAACPL